MTYTISNTAGATVATVPVATTTGATFPIEIVGQGISLYGPIIGQTQYHLLENFANTTPPSNPVNGMFWYNSEDKIPTYYNGSQFIPLSGVTSNSAALFDMLPSASNIDLTTAATVPLFTDPNLGAKFHATGLILVVEGTAAATTSAVVNLLIASSEDVAESIGVMLSTGDHGYYAISGRTASATAGATIQMEITAPATGGALTVSAYLFGFST